MLKININERIIERVDGGNIYEAIRFAEDAAGELNMNMNIVRSRNCIDVFAKRAINPNKIPLVQSIYNKIITCN